MKKKVLIVDDEYVFCKSLKAFLEKNGHEVLLTTNGEQALDMIRTEKPDLMTLDIRMPGMNGYEVLEKAGRISEGMPIIVISAIDIPDMENSLKKAGAREVFRKPANMDDLLRAIEEI